MPRYTLIIPTTQLHVLARWYPDKPLQAIKGQGTVGGDKTETKTRYGKKIEYDMRRVYRPDYKMEYGETTFTKILDEVRDFVPNVSFDYFAWIETNCDFKKPEWRTILCEWHRKTISTSKMASLIKGKVLPDQSIRNLIASIREEMKEVPEEVQACYRPSYMKLETTPDLHNDEWNMYTLAKDHPMMVCVSEVSLRTYLGDHKILK